LGKLSISLEVFPITRKAAIYSFASNSPKGAWSFSFGLLDKVQLNIAELFANRERLKLK